MTDTKPQRWFAAKFDFPDEWYIKYDASPGDLSIPYRERRHACSYTALTLTEYVDDPEQAAHDIAEALNLYDPTLQERLEATQRQLAEARAEIERRQGGSPELKLSEKLLAELTRARSKFPGKNVTFAALVEEVGELATATFEESAERVEKEAVQVAVMAMRMVLDGDHCFDNWRAEKGLDALDPSARAALAREGDG